jgi:hypothetical protein
MVLNSIEIIVVPLPFGVAKFGCSTATFVGRNSFKDFLNQSDDEDVTTNIVVQVVQQNPCEDESHRSKLSARENKCELCDSTKCEIESIHNESERYKPHKNREPICKMREDVFLF